MQLRSLKNKFRREGNVVVYRRCIPSVVVHRARFSISCMFSEVAGVKKQDVIEINVLIPTQLQK